MLGDPRSAQIIASGSVREYFRETVTSAASNQQVDAAQHTIDYVVDMLASYTRAEQLFEVTPEGKRIRPLAMLYFRAIHSDSERERNRALRRLGDVALFIAGLFTDSLNRKLVDVDYYIAMGGNAYGFLADNLRLNDEPRWRDVFNELSAKFGSFVDVLMEVGEQARPACQSDVLRLYELWLKTGSKRAAGQLRRLGIVPCEAFTSGARH